jgi:hypothetical protein
VESWCTLAVLCADGRSPSLAQEGHPRPHLVTINCMALKDHKEVYQRVSIAYSPYNHRYKSIRNVDNHVPDSPRDAPSLEPPSSKPISFQVIGLHSLPTLFNFQMSRIDSWQGHRIITAASVSGCRHLSRRLRALFRWKPRAQGSLCINAMFPTQFPIFCNGFWRSD